MNVAKLTAIPSQEKLECLMDCLEVLSADIRETRLLMLFSATSNSLYEMFIFKRKPRIMVQFIFDTDDNETVPVIVALMTVKELLESDTLKQSFIGMESQYELLK